MSGGSRRSDTMSRFSFRTLVEIESLSQKMRYAVFVVVPDDLVRDV
jgi:hypothetical protein